MNGRRIGTGLAPELDGLEALGIRLKQMSDRLAQARTLALVAAKGKVTLLARHGADVEAELGQCVRPARARKPSRLPLGYVLAVDANERAPALAHRADKVEAACLIDRADLAGSPIDCRRHHVITLAQQIHGSTNQLARSVRMRPRQASATQQRDDPAAVPVAVPHAKVLPIVIAIDDSTATAPLEENAKRKAADGGHWLIKLDDCLSFAERDRADDGAADIDGGRLRVDSRKSFPHNALPRLARSRRLARPVAALPTTR